MNQVALASAAVVVAFFVGAIPFGVLVSRAFYKTDIRTVRQRQHRRGERAAHAGQARRDRRARARRAQRLRADARGVRALGGAGRRRRSRRWRRWSATAGRRSSAGKGGKGVATYFGALFALWWPAGLAFMLVWIAVVIACGFASVGVDARDGRDGLRAVVRPGQGGPRLRHRPGAVRDLSPPREPRAPAARDGKPALGC